MIPLHDESVISDAPAVNRVIFRLLMVIYLEPVYLVARGKGMAPSL